MTRRKGIIAALASAVAAWGQSSSMGPLTIEFQKGPKESLYFSTKNCHSDGANLNMLCQAESIPEPQYMLVVKYGDRVVRLTAAEIMDALEGK